MYALVRAHRATYLQYIIAGRSQTEVEMGILACMQVPLWVQRPGALCVRGVAECRTAEAVGAAGRRGCSASSAPLLLSEVHMLCAHRVGRLFACPRLCCLPPVRQVRALLSLSSYAFFLIEISVYMIIYILATLCTRSSANSHCRCRKVCTFCNQEFKEGHSCSSDAQDGMYDPQFRILARSKDWRRCPACR